MSKRGYTPVKQRAKPKAAPKEEAVVETFKPTPTLQLIRPAVQLFRDNFIILSYILIIPALASAFGRALMGDVVNNVFEGTQQEFSNNTLWGVLILSISSIWLLVTTPAIYYVQTQIVQGKQVDFVACIRRGIHLLPRFYGLIVLVGLLMVSTALFIFPLFVFIRRYLLAPYFLVDGNTGIRVAMQRSAAATKPYRWYIWSMLGFILLVTSASYYVALYGRVFGGMLVVPISVVVALMLALRYKELAFHQSASSIKH